MNTKTCYQCNREINKNSEKCPYCNTNFVKYGSTNRKSPSLVSIIMVFICAFILPLLCLGLGIYLISINSIGGGVFLLLLSILVFSFWLWVVNTIR